MRELPNLPLRAVIGLLALIGLAGVLPVSLKELSTGVACPHLGLIPACHIVSLAYATVLLTVLHRCLWNPWLFLIAWLLIFLPAAAGSGLELTGHETCPRTDSGIPKCFFSLGLAVTLFAPFLLHCAARTNQGESRA